MQGNNGTKACQTLWSWPNTVNVLQNRQNTRPIHYQENEICLSLKGCAKSCYTGPYCKEKWLYLLNIYVIIQTHHYHICTIIHSHIFMAKISGVLLFVMPFILWTYLCSGDLKKQAFSLFSCMSLHLFSISCCLGNPNSTAHDVIWIAHRNSIIIEGNACARATAKPSTVKWSHLVPLEYYLTATEMENSAN